MRRTVILAAILGCTLAARAEVAEERFDDGRADRWLSLSGEWAVEDGAWVQSDASSPAYRMSLFEQSWREGAIGVTATPLERSLDGQVGASFGLVVKYVDDDRWCVARFGSYGSCNLLVSRPGGRHSVRVGYFEPQPGRSYRVRVIVRNGMVALARDGLVISVLQDPFPDHTGRPGLFTETRCRFDDVRIESLGE